MCALAIAQCHLIEDVHASAHMRIRGCSVRLTLLRCNLRKVHVTSVLYTCDSGLRHSPIITNIAVCQYQYWSLVLGAFQNSA